jgi:FkbM family methyltransferase
MKNIARKVVRELRKFVNSNDPSKMWGRKFDLQDKKCVQLDGFSLYVHPKDYIGGSIIASKQYEPHVTQLIRQKLKKGDTFLDIGANLGYFTNMASSIVGETGRVISFEPNPQNLQLMFESQLFNKFSNQTIYPFAASDKKGILKFTTVGSNGGVVSYSSKEQRYFFLVQSVIIDELLEDTSVNLIKMDIEAHEPMALRGMEKLIGKYRPPMITEFHPWAMEINNKEKPIDYLHQLTALGYKIGVISMSGVEFMTVEGIMQHWASLNQPLIHLDIYCEAI